MKGILKTTVNSVSRLFGREESDAQKPDVQPPPPPAGKAPRRRAAKKPRIDSRQTMADMEKIIDRMVAKHGTAVAGRVQLLRFDDILNSVGPKRAERLSNAIEGIVRKYVGNNDVLRKTGEGVFVVIFAGISTAEAEAKCALIRDDVNMFAAGDPNLKGRMEVATVVAQMDGTVKLQDLAGLDAVFEKLEQTQAQDPPSSPAPPPGDPPPARPEGGADTVSADAFDDWDQWLDTSAQVPAGGEPGVTPPVDRSHYDDPKWRDIAYAGGAMSDLATPEDSTVDVASLRRHLETAKIVARPIWDVNRNTLSALSCVPVQTATETVLSDAQIGANPSGVVTLSLDRLAVTWAASQLSAAEGPSPLLVIPMHFASLASMRNRSLLFSTFLEFKPNWRNRILGEVTFPDDVHMAAVEDVVRLIAPFVGKTGVCVGLSWRYFANLRAWGGHWVGFTVDDPDADEAAVMDSMANFAAGATEAGLVPYAKDLPTRNLVMAAAAMGVRHVFAAPKARPGNAPWQFILDDLYGP